MKIIAHPTRPGFWTILIGNSIYGAYDHRELAELIKSIKYLIENNRELLTA